MINDFNGIKKDHYWTIFAAILVGGILLRIIVVLFIPTIPTEDFWSYFQRAISIADQGVYEASPGSPDASYPPGYPLLLSLLFKLPFNRLLTAKFLNVFLSGTGLILTSAITKILFNRNASLVAGAVYALHPRSILSCTLIASENLFIPLILFWTYLVIRNWAGLRIKNTILNGIILGLSTLTRSVSWMLFVPWFISQLVKRIQIPRLILNFSILVMTQMIILLPWAIRNAQVIGSGTFLTSTAGINLFIGNNANSKGQWYYWPEDIKKVVPNFADQSIVIQNQIAGRLAWEWITQNPIEALKMYFRKWGLIFVNDHFALETAIYGKHFSPPWPSVDVLEDNSMFLPYQKTLSIVFDSYYWFIIFFGVVGAVVSLIKYQKYREFLSRWSFLCLSILYFPTVSAIFLASSRFHWPSVDLLIPFTGGLLSILFSRKMVKPSLERLV